MSSERYKYESKQILQDLPLFKGAKSPFKGAN